MGFFDKLKQALGGAASTAIQTAEQSAKDAVTNAVTEKVTGTAEGAIGRALGHVPGVPGSSIVTDAVQAGANAAIEGSVNQAEQGAADAIAAKVTGAHEGE
ncbi:MAG TPA: hypothetical protein VFA70_00125 [Dehalococcoidia bacterium]|nr:hypothetical protein [Dehalococcoidia bacterium]